MKLLLSILRRATSDGYIYQSLPQNLVEQYKGKTLSVTAKVYQDTASIAQVSLYDGAETASSTSATTGSWIDIGATRTISATARQIDVRAKVSSSDGNAWFKEIQVYEGSSLVYEWSPSKDDWYEFPLLNKGLENTEEWKIVGTNYGAFNTGWTNYGSGWQTLRFRKVKDVVYVEGFVRRSSGAETTVFTLPDGYRPTGIQMFAMCAGSAANVITRVDVNPTGVISWGGIGGVSDYLALFCSFSTL